MESTSDRKNNVFQRMGWMIGSVSLLFLASVGLELFVRQTFRQVSIATILLALSLASWLKVLGVGGLLFLSIWWVMKLWRGGTERAALSSYVSAESISHDLEKPGLRDPQYLSSTCVTSVGPSRSSREREERAGTNTRTRVA